MKSNRFSIHQVLVLIVFSIFFLVLLNVSAFAGMKFLTIGTGDVGGTFYPVGSTISKIINDNVDGVKANVESTGGSVDNSRMVGQGELQLGMAMGSVAYSAKNSIGKFENTPFPELRILFATYPSISQWIALEKTPVNSVYDLEGATIAVGMAGSGSEVVSKMTLNAAGITYDQITPKFLGVAEGAAAVRDGQADVAHAIGGIPFGGYLNLSETKSTKLIPVDKAIIEKIREDKPYYYQAKIPANSYKGQAEGVQSIGVKCVFIASTDLSDELAYDIVKSVWNNMDVMHSGHKATQHMTEDFVAQDLPFELHPGARKFWKEQGLTD
ncbi:MAG: TAXI family TRAP transporter solute-binding subunit [Bacteroidota bacterium]